MGKNKQKAFDDAVKDITDTFIKELSGKIANNINKKSQAKVSDEVKLAASHDEISNLEENNNVN
jgi:hypothetical protein